MIYLHTKIFDNQNLNYIFENPQKNIWGLIKDGVVMKELPTKVDLIQYRQVLFTNQSLVWLLDTFNTHIEAPSLFYFLNGYSNPTNQDKILEYSYQSLDNCKILIINDEFNDDENDVWLKLKEYFIQKYGDEAKNYIFSYENLKVSKMEQERLKETIEKLKGIK